MPADTPPALAGLPPDLARLLVEHAEAVRRHRAALESRRTTGISHDPASELRLDHADQRLAAWTTANLPRTETP